MFVGFAVAILTASRMSFLEPRFAGGQPWGVLLGWHLYAYRRWLRPRRRRVA